MSNKYISSEPWWAGYANVRMSLEIALSISEVTNRKFIIPPGIYFNAIKIFLMTPSKMNGNAL